MSSTPYIKREDDDGGGTYQSSNIVYPANAYPFSSNNIKSETQENSNNSANRLMSRAVLTRGFNSFDDANSNQASSMIDESDLLDLEGIGSPDVHPYNGGYGGVVNQSSGGGFIPSNNSTTSTSAPRDFSRTAQQHSYNGNKLPLGTTPPIPESTSPFDNFLLNQPRYRQQGGGIVSPGRGSNSSSNPQIQIQQQQPQPSLQKHNRYPSTGNASLGPGAGPGSIPGSGSGPIGVSYTSPRPESHIDRFMQENAIASNSSTPVGSYDGNYSTSPGFAAGSTGGGGFSLPSYGMNVASGSAVAGSLGKSSILTSDDKQQQLLERRRRRRESHNAVERRRRDNINEKIKELSELVPEKFLMAGMDQQLLQKGADDRPNKGTILARSVDYIRQLQSIIDEQNRAELDLQDLVNSLQRNLGIEVTEYKYTSAELALSRLGIGPQISGATPPVITGTGTGSGPDDLKSPISNSSQSSRPTTGSVPPSNGIIEGNVSNTANLTPHHANVSSSSHRPDNSNDNRSNGETPEFTPEFDLDFYQKQGYAAQDESAIFDDEYGYNR